MLPLVECKQDFEMESAELEEAIKLYNLWATSSCKMTACDDDDEC
jgi:transcription elongation factor Elf1